MNAEDLQSPSNFISNGKDDVIYESAYEKEPDSWRNIGFRSSVFTPITMNGESYYQLDQGNGFTLEVNEKTEGDDDESLRTTGNVNESPKVKDENFSSLAMNIVVEVNPNPKINLSLIEELEQKEKKEKTGESVVGVDSSSKKMIKELVVEFLKAQRRRKASIEMVLEHVRSNLPSILSSILLVFFNLGISSFVFIGSLKTKEKYKGNPCCLSQPLKGVFKRSRRLVATKRANRAKPNSPI